MKYKIKSTILSLSMIIGLSACSNKAEEVLQQPFVKNCTFVQNNIFGDAIVKCPITKELLDIQQQKPNSKFLTLGTLKFDTIRNDKDFIYVNVLGKLKDGCKEDIAYRVMAQNPNFEDKNANYAISICR